MLLAILSIVMVVLFTAFIVLKTYKRKEKLTGMPGMMIAMTIGMMSSLVLGVQLGIVFPRDLTVPSIAAILFGLGAGYFTGKPISILATLDGMLAGIMGGMMGAMLGVMIGPSYIMMIFVDILFIFILSVALQLSNQETDTSAKTNKSGIGVPFIGGILTVAFGIVAVGATLFYQFQPNDTSAIKLQESQSEQANSVQENSGYQIVSVDVKSDGFSQENIKVKAGVPTKINFIKHSGYTCIRSVQSKDLGIDVYLEKGDNFITLKDLKPGTYNFNCGMYMYYGTITVV
ncbi:MULTISPECIES: cupredoxin domain-containing protein [unclassified Paenibacillus]|uniref:cupredoxin domain-containing protein n=1 Tax=unclassified Paenibacillus TaxID=185978 RepID=UPI0009C4E409|nr:MULTISPECIES: cupredoxin domain-containing protein [unclassified Paenibacillus]SLJ89005.1 Cupredoxin-like domain-containing protein [Paenibacillus sp. RU5A]SOC60435.1 Cupredoxin-like domain-containing protein [Paenibacillus sp. RU26A]SOC68390.1 Cupredoxin-like domain-containing protein [Paenibacillus sp. RU5M]